MESTGGYRGVGGGAPEPFQALKKEGEEKALSSFKIRDIKLFYGELPYGLNFYTLFNLAHTKKEFDWWEKTIVKALDCTGACSLTTADVQRFFISDQDEHPVQTEAILQELAKRNILVSKQQPAPSLFWRLIGRGAPAAPTEFFYLPNIERACREVVQVIDGMQELEHRIMTMAEFQKLFSNVPPEALQHLEHELHRAYRWKDGDTECITLVPQGETAVHKERDRAVLKLKTSKQDIESAIAKLEERCQAIDREVVALGRTEKAKRKLLEKRLHSQEIESLQGLLHKVETALSKIEQQEVDQKIFEALKVGLEAQKALVPEGVEEAMEEVKEAFDEMADITQAFANLSLKDREELERELKELSSEEKPLPQKEEKSAPKIQAQPSRKTPIKEKDL